MTTAKQAQELIGRSGLWNVPRTDISVQVTINDIREVWGRLDYQIKPVAGSGRQWVSAEGVKLLGMIEAA